jgi:hypothetical protein
LAGVRGLEVVPRVVPLHRSPFQRLGVCAGAAIATVAVALAGSASLAAPATAQSEPASPASPASPATVSQASIDTTTTARLDVALRATSAGGAAPTTGTQEMPAVEDCGLGKSQVRPQSLILTCADGNDLAKDLAWSKWGPSAADAKGVDTWNECVPYCAASKTWYSTTATFTLSKPVHTTRGWLFERLTVHLTGRIPPKAERVITFSEAPVVNT